MPKVEIRKARKDYPDNGIKVGDTYYYTSLKTQRGGIIKRSLKPFKPSQLTRSPFKSGWLAMQEDWESGDKDAEAIRAAAAAIKALGEEAQGSFDNMPEGLQQGGTGQMLEARASACEDKAGELEGLADELESLDQPETDLDEPIEPLGDLETPEENEAARDAYDEELSGYEGWQAEVAEYEAELERIPNEADEIIGDMPE